ncbi:calpain-C-like isoform X2 [Artemia franciscana]|uniref:Calpain catalytic domain-containing protein n=1 Tax=Artemia franciscana TaxID=6661 RepID=A0AA88LKR3_ARTSF|nr:hypothetical protein QYM36_000194 [Artemia franciscana]
MEVKGISEYEKIKKSCQKHEILWEDPEFPAVQSSVFYHQTPPFQFMWKRPKELHDNPIFLKDSPGPFDVTPGKLGDRWFVSCIGTLYLLKGFFYRVVPADQSFEDISLEDLYCGVFRFRIWWCGEWVEVVIDDRLPTFNGKLVFAHCQTSGQFWPCLLEKAYAKLHGSYEALKYGTTLDGLVDLTGGITESIPIKNETANAARLLNRLLSATSVVTATIQTSNGSRSKIEKLDNGLLVGINYKVLGVEVVELRSNSTVHLVKLKHPHYKISDWSGVWSNGSSNWDEITCSEIERIGLKHLQEGEFWLPYADFCNNFTHIEIIHVDSETARDEVTLQGRAPWITRLHQGAWQRGVTAGGCRNNPDTFHINPQLNLVLSENEEVIISLCQHSVLEPKVIGFSVYKLEKPSSELISRSFFKKNKSLLNSQYTNSRQVSARCCFEQGGYLLVPTTFEPGQESSFTLRVFSAKPIKLKLIDLLPKMLRPVLLKATSSCESKGVNQYESVFLQLADEHRSVSCFELHELLEACLPNDYIKSCATIEVCRQIVMALGTSGYGRLKLSEFRDFMCSLKQWQISFKAHSKEKTGILRAERLRDALYDTGYQVNTEILSALAMKYMRKDGTLRFGDYVSIILLLSSSFMAFEKRDPLQNGAVKLSLSEWLSTSLGC